MKIVFGIPLRFSASFARDIPRVPSLMGNQLMMNVEMMLWCIRGLREEIFSLSVITVMR